MNTLTTDTRFTVIARLAARSVTAPAPVGANVNGDCRVWTGSKVYDDRYGLISVGGFQMGPHRVAYMALVGPIPDGYEIDHLCRVTLCINPDHLEAVTGAENRRRQGASRTHCKRGHLRTPESTWTYVDGRGHSHRTCRECARIRRTPPTAERRTPC